MNDLQSRWDLNAEALKLVAIIKKNFEKVGA